MRAVVTGGAGFIGSNLVDRLILDGVEVLIVDDLSNGHRRNLDGALAAGARLEQLDVRHGAGLRDVLTDFQPDTIFHLAAQVDVRASMADPAHDAAVNVVGSVNVFAAALAARARRVVNTSTGGAIYGSTERIPTPETEAAGPLSAYGLSKRTVEEYGAWFRGAHGLEIVTLRYGNVYGPRQDPAGDAGVVARFCDQVLAKEQPTVYGDGTQTRDFVYVADVVLANMAAAVATTLAQGVYNVGTGVEVSVLDLVDAVALAAGVNPTAFAPQFLPPRAGEVRRSCLDVTRARTDLLLPDPTPLEVGLAATLEWLRTQHQPGSPTGQPAADT